MMGGLDMNESIFINILGNLLALSPSSHLYGLMMSVFTTGLVILFSFVYYLMVSSFLLDVALRRLVKASFDESWRDISDLIISYFLGMFVYMYIIYFYGIYIDSSLIPQANPTKNITFIIPFGLGLLYTGRIITRRAGVFYGKLHFSAIFVSAAVVIGLEFTNVLMGGPVFSDALIYAGIMPHIHNYIVLLFNKFAVWSFIGTLILSTAGEIFLARQDPCDKSLLVISDKFPSDFQVMTGKFNSKNGATTENRVMTGISGTKKEETTGEKIVQRICCSEMKGIAEKYGNNLSSSMTDNRIRNMLSERDIVKVRCVTKSLRLVEYIKDSDINKYDSNRNVSCKVLKAPIESIISDRLEKEINIYTPHFFVKMLKGDLKSERNKIEQCLRNEYSRTFWDYWQPLVKSGRIIGREYYLAIFDLSLRKINWAIKRSYF